MIDATLIDQAVKIFPPHLGYFLCLPVFTINSYLNVILMFSLQEASLMVSENLNNPNKSRAKGPSGRKLPSRKRPEDEEAVEKQTAQSPFDANFKNKLAKCLIQKKLPEPEPEVDINSIGKINQAEFNKVWFFRVPSLSSLVNDIGRTSSQTPAFENVNDDSENNNVTEHSEKKISDMKSDIDNLLKQDGGTNDGSESPTKPKKTKIWKNCQIL